MLSSLQQTYGIRTFLLVFMVDIDRHDNLHQYARINNSKCTCRDPLNDCIDWFDRIEYEATSFEFF